MSRLALIKREVEERVWKALQREGSGFPRGVVPAYVECLELKYSARYGVWRCWDGIAVLEDSRLGNYWVVRVVEWADGEVGWDLVTITGNDVPIDKIIARLREAIARGRTRRLMRVRW